MTDDDTGPARICVTNAKGGTGKTTIAINVAGALNHLGRDVLFVDIDPQGNATEGLGLVDAYDDPPPTLFDVLTDSEKRDAISELILEHEEMDVIPSNIDLLHAEHELTIADIMARLKEDGEHSAMRSLSSLTINIQADDIEHDHALDVLSKALEPIEDDYDYIIVDSPPFYGKLTDASIFATGNILVPALTEATSERAIELLMQQVAALEDHVDMEVSTVGVVANRVENTNEDEEMIEWFNAVYPDTTVYEIRKRVALQRAFSAGKSLFEYDPSVDMAAVFESIAVDLDKQFNNPEVKP
jgi:chromosome partitioning protein